MHAPRRSRLGLLLLLAAIAAIPAVLWWTRRPPPPAAPNIGQVLGGAAQAGYARALKPRPFQFPRDYGPHPRFRNEWWYFTGNLRAADGRRFGYELTLFRIALSPKPVRRPSHWATNQMYMAHFAVTDVNGKLFHYYQRFARGAAGLAGARADPLRLWLGDWSVRAADGAQPPWILRARAGGTELTLQLTPVQPVVPQGDRGLSRKGAKPGDASYYYSIPRLASRGRIHVDGHSVEVHGLSWMDREWSTSALGPHEAGWDWFALQLDDGWDLMFYRLRKADGSTGRFSQGSLIDPKGHARRLALRDVQLQVTKHWRSPDGAVYPAGWRLSVPSAHLSLNIHPLLADQELQVAVRYWEGAVTFSGSHRGRPVRGSGYVELTGYAGRAAHR